MNEEYKTVKVIVDDMSVKLETKATMIPKCIVEQILNEVLKETKYNIPRSEVDAGLRKYIKYVEHNRNRWRVTALVIFALFCSTRIIRILK